MIYNELVENTRPFILCCVVKGIDLHDKAKLTKFFQIQTKIHESEICAKRVKASIGTHDLSKIASSGGYINYTVRSADNLTLIPLGRVNKISASELIATMKGEVEMIRRVDRRKVTSGLYKYLHLVDNRNRLACLEDANGNVISFPPLVNSELTKVNAKNVGIMLSLNHFVQFEDFC